MPNPTKKPSALAVIVGGGGRSPAPPSGPPGPPGKLELMAAQQFVAAIQSGDPMAVVESYRALKEACEAAY